MKKTFLLCVAAALALSNLCHAAQPLEFKQDSTFKIMQLSDLHLRQQYPDEYNKVLDRIATLAAKEKPDVILITGDLVYSKPAGPQISDLAAHLDALQIPWAVMYGNHDAEQDLSRQEMSKLYSSGKYSLNTLNGSGELADMEVPVMLDGKPAWYLYIMDSGDYTPYKDAGKYGNFTFDQVVWMRNCCKARTAPDGAIAPSFAFFHIPLHEYVDAWYPMDNPRQGAGDKLHCAGMRGENIAHGALNTGMFAAMREGGSVVATFAGHDHDNDFVACYKGIALCYGRFTGGNTVYNNIPAGARLIEIKAGSRKFETWIRDDQGRRLWPLNTDGNTIHRHRDREKGCLYGMFGQ